MTRQELDKLVSIKLDLTRAMWLLMDMIGKAAAEHQAEDVVNAALEQSDEGAANDQRPV